METSVILVDEDDNVVGKAEKLLVHQQGLLHRAFSIFIYRYKNNRCEVLLQKRQQQKYHSGGLWTNTCCSHPMPSETISSAAARRLYEELGIRANLREIGVFHYCAEVGEHLIENELDHVLIGEMINDSITINAEEVSEIDWIDIDTLQLQITQYPERYTAWLSQALAIFCKHA
jgi:isopentenyl-diphosphate delta-isomerase type 1